MKLIITEKPSVARDIAKVLNIPSKQDGYIQSDTYQVTWALGHLIQLSDPDFYGENLKNWSLNTLPIIPKTFNKQAINNPGSEKQLNVIKPFFYGLVCLGGYP